MTGPDQSVNQVDYLQVLEEDLERETRARRLLTALLAQRTRTLQTYVERFGDITAPDTEPRPEPTPDTGVPDVPDPEVPESQETSRG